MSIQDAATDIREEFDFLDDWEERYAHIIDLGKANTGLAAHERTEETRVRGCASQVWLVSEHGDNNTLILRAAANEISSFDANEFLQEIGVSGALTAQRSNGLASMLARIQSDAQALLAS